MTHHSVMVTHRRECEAKGPHAFLSFLILWVADKNEASMWLNTPLEVGSANSFNASKLEQLPIHFLSSSAINGRHGPNTHSDLEHFTKKENPQISFSQHEASLPSPWKPTAFTKTCEAFLTTLPKIQLRRVKILSLKKRFTFFFFKFEPADVAYNHGGARCLSFFGGNLSSPKLRVVQSVYYLKC